MIDNTTHGNEIETRIQSDLDGTAMRLLSWPIENPRAVIQIAHGLAEHCGRYRRFAAALNAAGYSVTAHDHRGHGPQATTLGDAGNPGWDGLIHDTKQVTAIARKAHPDVQLILFGHSMGSFVTQNFLQEYSDQIDGVILSGTTDIGMVATMIAAGGEAPSLKSYNAAFEPSRTDFDWLSRDHREVDLYVADPLCGFDPNDAFSAGMLEGALKLANEDAFANVRQDLPILIAAGDADPLNANLALLHALTGKLQTAGLNRVTSKHYSGARHEILNEINRDDITSDIIDWIDAILS